jgi:hypothetical protein
MRIPQGTTDQQFFRSRNKKEELQCAFRREQLINSFSEAGILEGVIRNWQEKYE